LNSATENIVEAMDPISLSEMDSVSLMNRVDTKYVLNERNLERLLKNICSQYRVLSIEQTRLSPYNTLYFDSPDLECFSQHHNGKMNRRKFRMREYQSTGVCYLEVKHKNNKGRTQKKRIQIPAIEESFSEDATAFLQPHRGDNFPLQAQIWTNFSRITLVDRGMRERVTLDCDLTFRSGERQREFPDLVIAEIKQESDNRSSLVRQQLRRQGVRPLRVSKYCLGSMLLNPQLKANRFKEKLLAISKLTSKVESV